MANTYTQIHLQLVFAVKFRAAVIDSSWKEELYKYMTGIVQEQKHKMIIINGVADHVHWSQSLVETMHFSARTLVIRKSPKLVEWIEEVRIQ